MTLTRRLFTGAAVSATLMLSALPAVSNASAQEKIVLKGITPWVADYDLSQAFFLFKGLVEKKFGDRVEIKYLGGPEIAEPNNQFAALKNGVVDVLLGAAAYYRTEVPLAAAVQFSRKLPSELRTSGYFNLMQEIHADAGVVYLANTAGGNQFRVYLKKPIEKPDFSGLRIRVSPVYTPLVNALGGTPVSMAPGDVYTGLERGVIDGYGWTYTGIDVFGWNEVSKYVINHPFYSLDGSLLINQSVWDKLPEDVKAGLREVGVDLEQAVQDFIRARLVKEDARLEELGMKLISFSNEDATRFVDTAYEAGWKDFLEKNKSAFAAKPGLASKLVELGK